MATLLLGALLACGAKETGHTATSAMPYCEETEDALGWDDASPGGGSTPAEALAVAEGTRAVPLTWSSGGSTGLALTVTRDGSPSWVTSVAVYPDTGGPSPSIGVICEDHLAMPVQVGFVTDDGAFAESWPVVMTWPDPVGAEGVDFYVSSPPESLVGAWRPDDTSVPDLSTYDTVTMAFEGRWISSGAFGTVAVLGEKTGPTTASQTAVEVARWELDGE
jgi:hypothetical protein